MIQPISISPTKINQLNFCQQFLIYRNITTPSLSYAHEHCRNPKKVNQKVATLEKTTFLYWSKSLISLWRNQRIFISDRRVSPPPSLSRRSTHPTSLRSVCSILQYLSVCITWYNCRQSRRKEVGWVLPMDYKGGDQRICIVGHNGS